ncbi:hypothetical protein TNCV_2993541 [Trichonephila clavipes]|nr:hypothetical protein TNCV_2993541 [Trichonephila clavipes]
MNVVSLTVGASLANTGFNFSSDNLTAKAGLYWAARMKWPLRLIPRGTRTTPQLAPTSPSFHATLTRGRLSFDRFNVHRPHTRRVFSGAKYKMTRLPESSLQQGSNS